MSKSSLLVNLSSQANTSTCKKTNVSQFNFVGLLGGGNLSVCSKNNDKSPISININSLGELTIDGIDESFINDKNIKIYSDENIKNSED